ncbi:tail fiber protein [Gorillibacterium massiliense]|uniref:tail fiber protein n=1 Tax=Gorillibacterium massiliense TaxID=1280390 RepID=UPI0004B1B8DA|nr:tail fiber protein [Gorillibacterium massiliense]
MAGIRILRGLKADLPILKDGEPALCTDTEELFVGTEDKGNIQITIPSASLITKGKVQLSNATDSTDEIKAATPKAVKAAYDRGSAGVTAAATAQTRADQAFQSASDGKTAIAAAITGMGQAAAANETFTQLATKISKISTDSNVVVGEVLSGKTFYQGGTKKTGTMPNRAGDTSSLSTVVSGTTIKLLPSAGYRDGVDDFVTLTDLNFIESNIKDGVALHGLTGTYVAKRYAIVSVEGLPGQYTYTITGINFFPTLAFLYYPGSVGIQYNSSYYGSAGDGCHISSVGPAYYFVNGFGVSSRPIATIGNKTGTSCTVTISSSQGGQVTVGSTGTLYLFE